MSKKKADITNILDDLRCEDPKKRLAAVQEIKQVAAAIGPARVRSELISFLGQFVDDEENIVLQLLNQFEGFAPFIGGPQNQRSLIPLLISFCKTDEKKIASKSCQLIQKIIQNNKDLALETIRKLIKTDMNIARQCGVQLISSLLPQLESIETGIMELYSTLHSVDNSQVKIMASKYLHNILRNLKGKEEVSKILQVIYTEGDQLAKIHALDALTEFYEINNNFSLAKFKQLSVINSWRINIKICQLATRLTEKVSKTHFKLILEPIFLKFMTSNESQLRSASCQTLTSVCRNMTDQECKSKLQPILKRLAGDTVQFVKIQLSKNLVPLCNVVTPQFMYETILPIIFGFIKDANSQITLGIVKYFDYLSSKLSREILQDKVIKPLLQQLTTDNWRIKCQIIQILKGFLINHSYLTEPVLKVFIGLTDDRIDAVRLKANQLLIEIISKNPKQWCDQNIIPKIFTKESMSYIKKQNLLQIIQKTITYVSDKELKDTYQMTIANYLNDKVPNVRLKTLQVLKTCAKLSNPTIQKQIQKLKGEKDQEIREIAKKIKA